MILKRGGLTEVDTESSMQISIRLTLFFNFVWSLFWSASTFWSTMQFRMQWYQSYGLLIYRWCFQMYCGAFSFILTFWSDLNKFLRKHVNNISLHYIFGVDCSTRKIDVSQVKWINWVGKYKSWEAKDLSKKSLHFIRCELRWKTINVLLSEYLEGKYDIENTIW